MAIALDQAHVDAEPVSHQERPGLPFSFHGKAGEYFGIWIVNLLLSIVTLGIYSAWAKVRTKRYFYGNTRLDGSSFDYLATPIQILKGRIIAFVVLGAMAIGVSFSPAFIPIYILLYAFVPLIIVRALRFNARHSSYRNVRFDFVGKTGKSYLVYLLLPIIGFLTLGLLAPYIAFASKQYVINGSRYGQSLFSFDGKAGRYYFYYFIAFLLGVLAYFLAIAVFFASVFSVTDIDPAALSDDIMTMVSLLPAALLGGGLFLFVYSYLTVRLQNYAFNTTKIGNHQFHLNLELWPFMWIRFSNVVAIILSAGLLIPWATIRMARYQIERMSLTPHGDLETAVAEEQKRTRALGEEFGEGMDLDLGLGV